MFCFKKTNNLCKQFGSRSGPTFYSLDPDQDRHSVGPDLDPNCLQRHSVGPDLDPNCLQRHSVGLDLDPNCLQS